MEPLEDRLLLAVVQWDGGPSGGRGGTAEIVEHARRINKQLWWIDIRSPFTVHPPQ